MVLHLPEKTRTELIALDPYLEQSLSGEREFARRQLQKLFQDGAEIGFPVFEHRTQQHPTRNYEELVPQLARFLQSFWLEVLHLKSRAAQGFCRSSHYSARFRRDRRAAIVFEIADSQFPDLFFSWPA